MQVGVRWARARAGKIRKSANSNPWVIGLDKSRASHYAVPINNRGTDMEAQTAIEDWVREQSKPLQGTTSAALAISRVKYSHDAMIDILIADPSISQGAIAQQFGYTQAWVSRVMNSDAFLARMAERKSDLVDPSIALTLDEKFRALANQSIDIVMEKLAATKNPDTALKALEMSSKALGYGARQQNLNLQQNFVVAMPQKHSTPESWAEQHQALAGRSPALATMVTEVEARG